MYVVWPWFGDGSAMVWSWFGHGLVMIGLTVIRQLLANGVFLFGMFCSGMIWLCSEMMCVYFETICFCFEMMCFCLVCSVRE